MAPEDAKDEIDKLNKDIDVTAQQIASTTPAEHEKASSRLKEFREKIENWWRKPKRSETKPAADAASKVLPKE
jgi:peptidoglycan hydrolase CwlO-like protein